MHDFPRLSETAQAVTVPMWLTIAASFRTVLKDNIRHFPRSALAPLVLSLLLLMLRGCFGLPVAESVDQETLRDTLLDFLISMVETVPYVMISVTWHRLVLLGPQRGRPLYAPSWRKRHWGYLGYYILLIFMGFLVIALVVGASEILTQRQTTETDNTVDLGSVATMISLALAILFCIWVFARFGLVLPARAVDRDYGLRESWRQTRGNDLRIVVVYGLVLGLTAVAYYIIMILMRHPIRLFLGVDSRVEELVAEWGRSEIASGAFLSLLPLVVVQLLVGFVVIAISVVALSLVFKACSGWVSDDTSVARQGKSPS